MPEVSSNIPKIIIADDDDGILEVVSIVFQEKGYDIIPVSNGNHVYDEVVKHEPSLVLLDLWMPGEGGEKITHRLKKNSQTQHIPIIILSANRRTEKISQEAAADGFLLKPFDIHELEQLVDSFVNKN